MTRSWPLLGRHRGWVEEAPVEEPVPARLKVARPHLFDLMLALMDARASRVSIMDAHGTAELERYLQARHAAR